MPYYIKSMLQSGKASLFSGDSSMAVAANKWKELWKFFNKKTPIQALKRKIRPKAALQLSCYGIGGCCVLYRAKTLYLDEQCQMGRNGIYIRIFECNVLSNWIQRNNRKWPEVLGTNWLAPEYNSKNVFLTKRSVVQIRWRQKDILTMSPLACTAVKSSKRQSNSSINVETQCIRRFCESYPRTKIQPDAP